MANRQLNWPRACFAATLYVIALLLACQDATRGGRLLGAAVLLGGTWTGALLAGLLVWLANHPGSLQRVCSTRGRRLQDALLLQWSSDAPVHVLHYKSPDVTTTATCTQHRAALDAEPAVRALENGP